MAKYQFNKISEGLKQVSARDHEAISIHISTTNSKLGNIPSFNLLPAVTCSPDSCKHCLREGCYAVKNLFRGGYDVNRNNVFSSWAENTWLAFNDLPRLEKALVSYLDRVKNTIKLFRIHSSGDFFSVEYAEMWKRIATTFPTVRFLAFTKQWAIVREVSFDTVPNFSLVLSGWTGISIPDDLREKYACAWCDDGQETRIPENAMQCPGGCESCGLCWYLKELGRDTKFEKH